MYKIMWSTTKVRMFLFKSNNRFRYFSNHFIFQASPRVNFPLPPCFNPNSCNPDLLYETGPFAIFEWWPRSCGKSWVINRKGEIWKKFTYFDVKMSLCSPVGLEPWGEGSLERIPVRFFRTSRSPPNSKGSETASRRMYREQKKRKEDAANRTTTPWSNNDNKDAAAQKINEGTKKTNRLSDCRSTPLEPPGVRDRLEMDVS